MPIAFNKLTRLLLDADPRTAWGRALLEERYRSLNEFNLEHALAGKARRSRAAA